MSRLLPRPHLISNNNNNIIISIVLILASVSLRHAQPQYLPMPGSISNETQCRQFLEEYNGEAMMMYAFSIEKEWLYNTNTTQYNHEQMIWAHMLLSNFKDVWFQRALVFNTTNFSAETVRRMSYLLQSAGTLEQAHYQELMGVIARMKDRYANGQPCAEDGRCYLLTPDLENIMASSRNYTELFWAWDAWREEVGAPARWDFARYVELQNMFARANGASDFGAFWRSTYEVDNFDLAMEELYQQLRPLYENLHAYVRRKLYGVYGADVINLKGPIPAHVLGSMFALSWEHLSDICTPFPNRKSLDVTDVMQERNYTVPKLVRIAEEFFTSLGLIAMPPSIWDDSMFVRPTDGRTVDCSASAWDFLNGKDYRIKMCAGVSMSDLGTIHHEMGHTQYQLQYRDLFVEYRAGANPAFHEAVGDALALSASTPKHLHAIGLFDELVEDEEADLNHLMEVALTKIAFLPYGYLMDLWRWGVFNGTTPESKYNEDWWKLRLRYQGIIPPNKRTERDFDPGAKFHIPASIPYIRYFISFIIQFQFHDAMCKAAGHVGPLHKCDTYRSREAGTLLANMLKKGASVPWPESMEALTGSRSMNATALVSYFQPLINYLTEENRRNGDILGWPEMYTPADPYSHGSTGTAASTLCLSFGLLLLLCAPFLLLLI